ncbi:MAG: type II toxin-antitoxin system prevent-host-death family antitoxin [Candidatus Sumerlaeota bacterium]|nr:type II toxin-antitoxin system prevent-host-death family antitoxin [Candidatus Sumerlaeota bacterium]
MDSTQTSYIVNEKGRKTGVVLSVRKYERLMEDLHDLVVIAERHEEKPISLAEMKKRLNKDQIAIRSIHRPRKGWAVQIKRAAKREDDSVDAAE